MKMVKWYTFLILGLLIILLSIPIPAAANNGGWWDISWGYRVKITLQNQDVNEILTDFPVQVCVCDTWFDFSKAKAGGADLRFVDSDGTLLNHEIEEWNTTGCSCVWVKIPQVSTSGNTDYFWCSHFAGTRYCP